MKHLQKYKFKSDLQVPAASCHPTRQTIVADNHLNDSGLPAFKVGKTATLKIDNTQ